MNIDKAQIIDYLQSLGKDAAAIEAADELPDTVDTDDDADLLTRFGIGAQELEQFGL